MERKALSFKAVIGLKELVSKGILNTEGGQVKKILILIMLLVLSSGASYASVEEYAINEEAMTLDPIESLRVLTAAGATGDQSEDALQYCTGTEAVSVSRDISDINTSISSKEAEICAAKKGKGHHENKGHHEDNRHHENKEGSKK